MHTAPLTPTGTSVEKALALVEVLAGAGPNGLALKDVVRETGMNKASAHRLLQTLARSGYAEQDAAGRYRFGSKPTLLVEQYHGEENLPALFRPALLAISGEVQELVHLAVLEAHHVVYLDKVEPDRAIRVWSRVGRQASVLTTALGRAMIAAEPGTDRLLDEYVTDAPADVAARFHAAVPRARESGFAREQEENEAGISCVAVALQRPSARPVAVSITGPTSRLDDERIAQLGALLRRKLPALAPAGFQIAPAGR